MGDYKCASHLCVYFKLRALWKFVAPVNVMLDFYILDVVNCIGLMYNCPLVITILPLLPILFEEIIADQSYI